MYGVNQGEPHSLGRRHTHAENVLNVKKKLFGQSSNQWTAIIEVEHIGHDKRERASTPSALVRIIVMVVGLASPLKKLNYLGLE
jgi:hypothetical protein